MNIELWCIGKNKFDFVDKGIELFANRIKHYSKLNVYYFSDVKTGSKSNPDFIKNKEADLVLNKLQEGDYLILLDEKGKSMDSVQFANYIENKMIYSSKRVIFLIGGAFGFSQKIYKISKGMLSLSKMTFSHQLIRLIFVEQLYRAFTIIRNEKYHNV